MAPTDLNSLPVPAPFADHVANTSRESAVLDHRITINPEWWSRALEQRDLPGIVVTDPSDTTNGEVGSNQISRATLFALAEPALADDDQALTLLWSTLAWGAGTSARNMKRRLNSVSELPGAAAQLRHAAVLSRSDPSSAAAAYKMLRPGNKNLVTYLGPAFFSKYLYFAGGGDPKHPCLILDARVATALRGFGWASLYTGGAWPASTYERYCDLLHRWAEEASTQRRSVAADELEVWLFRHG